MQIGDSSNYTNPPRPEKLAVKVAQKPITFDLANQLAMALDCCDHPRLFEYVVVTSIPCDIAMVLWSMKLNDQLFLRDVTSFFNGWEYVDSMVNALRDGIFGRYSMLNAIQLQVLEF